MARENPIFAALRAGREKNETSTATEGSTILDPTGRLTQATGTSFGSMPTFDESIDPLATNQTLLDQMRKAGELDTGAYGLRETEAGTEAFHGVSGGHGPEATLRYSRLADAMNNRRYLSQRGGIFGVALRGGGRTTNEPTYGQDFQRQIETEEMRQQQRQRLLNDMANARRMINSGLLFGAQLEMMQAKYNQMREIFGQLQTERLARTRIDFEERLRRLQIPEEQANILIRLTADNPLLGMQLAPLFSPLVTTPSPEHAFVMDYARRVVQAWERGDITSEEANRRLAANRILQGAASLEGTLETGGGAARDVTDSASRGINRFLRR